MRLKLLCCEVFAREIAVVIAASPHEVSLDFFSKGWHEAPCRLMCRNLQQAVDAASAEPFDAIVLAYGLCSYGIVGLKARAIPLVIPRAHDCIALLLGGRERYAEYQSNHPGTFYRSSGWLERRRNPPALTAVSAAQKNGLNSGRDDFVAAYGPEAGDYLFSILGDQTRHYRQLTFIEMGVEPDSRFEDRSRAEAEQNGWHFQKTRGDLRLLRNLLNGAWDDADFLLVPPGMEVRPSYDSGIIRAAGKTV